MPNYYITGDGLVSEEALQHYGVLGMKWGVRRSKEQLERRRSKLSAKNEKLSARETAEKTTASKNLAKSKDFRMRNKRHTTRLDKATAKKEKYDAKLNYQLGRRRPDEDKVAKYSRKSAEQQAKINKANRKLKYNKWEMKAKDAKFEAEKARHKIEKNEKLMSVLNKTIKAIDEGTIQQGRMFMKYVDE